MWSRFAHRPVPDGHVLLEAIPASARHVGKDFRARVGTACRRYGRIQFTPDLMPADITGTPDAGSGNMNRLAFARGPIFKAILLADEINRATPKTQSAMLEAMAERQVTVLGQTSPPAFGQPRASGGRSARTLHSDRDSKPD